MNRCWSLKQHGKVDFLFLISQMGKPRLREALTLGPRVSSGSQNGQLFTERQEGSSTSLSPTRAALRCGRPTHSPATKEP